LSVSYYDYYDFYDNQAPPFAYDSSHIEGLPDEASSHVRGMATGGMVRILDSLGNVTTNWLKKAAFYDELDRTIQAQSNNHLDLNAVDKSSVLYNNIRRVDKTKTTHTAQSVTTSITQRNDYDHAGRVLKSYHQIIDTTEYLVAQYEYNAIGQLVDKKLHQPDSLSEFLQSVDYRYNIRGWLTSINNAQLQDDSDATNDDSNDFFGMELAYNTSAGMSNTSYYNGNISAMKWKTLGDSEGTIGQRSYKYAYDKSDKLKDATFQVHGGSSWDQQVNTLNESMAYDHGGNILKLKRNKNSRGLDVQGSTVTVTNSAATMDSLSYSYSSNTNRIDKVEDSGTTEGFANGSVGGTNEYTYTDDGSANKDDNKGISSITYNMLGKAQVITFSNGSKVEYVYDAAGTKLKVTHYDTASQRTVTNYAGGFMYQGTTPVLSQFSSPEGRVVNTGSGFEYQYALSDHQGNTRVLFTSGDPEISVYTATFEDSTQTTEMANFNNYPTSGKRSDLDLYDHTDDDSVYTNSYLLTGGYAGQVGLAKSFHAYPGDSLFIEAWAKYYDTGGSGNLTGFATALLTAFGTQPPSGGEVGTPSYGLNTWGSLVAAGDGEENNSYPLAFVNIVVFDKNFNLIEVAYDGIDGGHQVGVSPDVDHDVMKASYFAKEECFVFMYISNENPTLVDVYFDDIMMTHKRSRLIQGSEYYPYGMLAARSWTREDATENNFLANGATELNTATQMYDLYYRNYDPVLGRFGQVDPVASKYGMVSPYHFSGNNPVSFNDPSGNDYGDSEYLDTWYGVNGDHGFGSFALRGPYIAGNGYSVYRDMDPSGHLTGRRLQAISSELSTMINDAEKVNSGEMSLEEYAAKYATISFVHQVYWKDKGDYQNYVVPYKPEEGDPTVSIDTEMLSGQLVVMGGRSELVDEWVTVKPETDDFLDDIQTAVDIVGIADPTGISDAANSIVYAGRGKWKDAAISAVGVIPYVGDIAKISRLSKKGYTVYIGVKDGMEYVGMTGNLAKRYSKAQRTAMRITEVYMEIPGKELARAIEQTLINNKGLGNLSNKINSISPANQEGKLKKVMNAALEYMANH